ncbi:NUDIX domain-containing protein [Microlunatus sp. Gsoil 973]|uniref:NUDIX domain-containing protein n=1 Tax=Microlunatus sp. Gsoil 973 TaxID=2672569 RepID=UPI0012B4BC98|nr:NUDIX domain-containing protein [Microlunatus sp. Gsoil 973]QGN33102.1 NUDIX domain-containing protein [Microlunatus sp. Gsoil 973]
MTNRWDLLAGIWKRLHGPAQWRILWCRHATFMIGVTGAVLDDADRVLLLKHRFWKDNPWGTPSGYLERGEAIEDGFAREVREETGLTVDQVRVIKINSGFRLRIEVGVVARVSGSAEPTIDGVEVEEARFFPVADLPDDLRAAQRAVIEAALG